VQALLAVAALRAQAGGSPDEVAALIQKAVAANPSELAPRLSSVSYYIRVNDPKKAAGGGTGGARGVAGQARTPGCRRPGL
jgi:hypothetical protein